MGSSSSESLRRNPSYKDDTNYSIQLNRWFLTPIGAWPISKSKSTIKFFMSLLLSTICVFLLLSVLITLGLNILFEEKDPQQKIKTFGPFAGWVLAFTKYFVLLLQKGGIDLCIKHMEIDWKNVKSAEYREIMLSNAKFGRYIAVFCAIWMHGGVFSYTLIMPSKVTIVEGNETIVMKLLPYAFYNKILDTRFSPAYEIVFWIQTLSGFTLNSVTASACSLAAVLVAHANGQLKILMVMLDHFFDVPEEKDNSRESLADIVEHHLRVLRFVSRIEDVLNKICLFELVGCTLLICLLGYYIIKEWENQEGKNLLSYCIMTVAFSFNIFIFCYIGELLTEQCRKVGETAFMTRWYLLPGKVSICLVLIISRSSVVTRITAGKLIKLSLASFGDVIRTALVYLNMLRTMTMR